MLSIDLPDYNSLEKTMNRNSTTTLAVILAAFFIPFQLAADFAPDSARGFLASIQITSGTGFLATSGSAVIQTALSVDSYSLLAESSTIEDAFGTYTWTKVAPDNASITLFDKVTRVTLTYNLFFDDEDGGRFSVNDPNIGSQEGTFRWFNIIKPSETPGAVSVSQPRIEPMSGKLGIHVSFEKSEDLKTWEKATGTFSLIEDGEIIFTTDADDTKAFYIIRLGD